MTEICSDSHPGRSTCDIAYSDGRDHVLPSLHVQHAGLLNFPYISDVDIFITRCATLVSLLQRWYVPLTGQGVIGICLSA